MHNSSLSLFIRRAIFFVLLFISHTAFAQVVTVSTFAGNGEAGYADGTGASARFTNPFSLAFDGAGNLYVADAQNHRIRKITPLGVVSTLAGSGMAGYRDGAGLAAQFNQPRGVAVDGMGNVYVSDQLNNRVRKITSEGLVSTLAGSGDRGFADGQGRLAVFNWPHNLTLDRAGNIYVADRNNHCIRKITASGLVSTLTGGSRGYADGDVTTAKFILPVGIAVDNIGNVYIAEDNRIRKITPQGIVSTLAGMVQSGRADGMGITASFSLPYGLCVDRTGNIYVADRNNARIRKITPAGTVTTLAGDYVGYADGMGIVALFSTPTSIAIDNVGAFFVADEQNHCIRKIVTSGSTTQRRPELNLSPVIIDFGAVQVGMMANNKAVASNGYDLLSNVTITTPPGFELYNSSTGTWVSSLTFTPVNSSISQVTLLRFIPTEAKVYSGNIAISSTEADTKTVAVTGRGLLDPQNIRWQPIVGPNWGGIQSLAKSGSTLFAGATGFGVFRSTDNGATWTQLNRGILNSNIRSLGVSGSTLLVGTFFGMFRSTDNGATWAAANTGITNSNVYALTVNGSTIFAGTGGGVFRSQDNGLNWTPMNTGIPNNTDVFSFTLNGSTLFAGTKVGVYRSQDNGSNWTPVNSGITNPSVFALTVSGSSLFAGTIGGGIFRSQDNGSSWIPVNNGITNLIILSLTESGSTIFAGTSGGGVFSSTNNGSTWQATNSGLTNLIVYSLLVSGNKLFAGSGPGIFQTDISGITSVALSTLSSQVSIVNIAFAPHPVIDRTRLTVELRVAARTEIVIFDALGRLIKQHDVGDLEAGTHSIDEDMSDLPTGLYSVVVRAGTEQTTKMIQHIR